MPGLTGPLFSLGASGTIAKTLTYASWRGIKYARQRVVPANPKTSNQEAARLVFGNLQDMFKYLPAYARQSYLAAAKGRPLTDRNLWTQQNAYNLYHDADIDMLKTSPGTGGAPAPTNMALTESTTHIAVNLTAGALPVGWTLINGAASAVKTFDPTTDVFVAPFFSDSDADPTALDIVGLTTGTDYLISAFVVYQDSSDRLVYSVSLQTTGTTS